MSARQSHRARVCLLVAAMLAAFVVGCDNGDGGSTLSQATPSSSPTRSAEQQIRQTIEYWLGLYTKILVAGTYRIEALSAYLLDPLFTTTHNGLEDLKRANIVYKGPIAWKTLSARASGTTGTAVVCLDMSRTRSVNRTTGAPVTVSDHLPRYQVVFTARVANAQWYLYGSTEKRRTAC